jgi:riboflavin kinase / FMN adenylyltransferase
MTTLITSIVVHGEGQASTFEVPTANLEIGDQLDKEGVYAVTIQKEDKTFQGVSYFGKAWLLEGAPQRLEVHLFDYEGPAFYGDSITVEFLKFLRGPLKFGSEDEAKEQIQKDIVEAKELFKIINKQ